MFLFKFFKGVNSTESAIDASKLNDAPKNTAEQKPQVDEDDDEYSISF